MDFQSAYAIGRRKLSIVGLFRKKHLILSLKELTSFVKPSNETYLGIKDIEVSKIVGTTNRSNDFSKGFYPVHKWMVDRWEKVKKLLLDDKIEESIKVFQYGGYYFVDDGNHRVSVAKCNGIEFLTAEVTRLKINVKLCRNMSRRKIGSFVEKEGLQGRIAVFDVIADDDFFVNRAITWGKIEKSIFDGHKKWFIQKNSYTPDNETLIQSWVVELYETTMEFIKKHHLASLTPGLYETDIFCELMDLWEARGGDIWFPEIYDLYVKKLRRKYWWKLVVYMPKRFFHKYSATSIDEYQLFLQVSRLLFFKPDAEIPIGNCNWYRFLRLQLMGPHYNYLSKKLGRNPYVNELTVSWYEELFLPVQELYEKEQISQSFSKFYMELMSRWPRVVKKSKRDIFLEEIFKSYVEKVGFKITKRNRGEKESKNKKSVDIVSELL